MSAGEGERLLVLCVDRDDDIGRKAGIETPVTGREACLAAGVKLAVSDPEEADANAIFAAVKEYDGLKSKGIDCEVAVVSGLGEGGIEADKKVRDEFRKVAEETKATGVVLVSDGVDDELVIPIIQSYLPVVSVRRVVVKQSQSIETSYMIFGRYLKSAFYDPRYSKYALGVPGIIFFALGILIMINKLTEATAIALGIIGIAMIVRGFELDKVIPKIVKAKMTVVGYVKLFIAIAGSLIILTGLYQGVSNVPEALLSEASKGFTYALMNAPAIIGYVLEGSIPLIWIAMGIYLGSMLPIYYVRGGKVKMIRNSIGLVILILLYQPVLQFSYILEGRGSPVSLFVMIMVGLALSLLALIIVYQHFAKRKEV